MAALDRTDYKIVALLRKNARLSNKEVARQVGLAPSTCLVRTRMLQQSGVITGFKAEVNPLALGVGLQAMIAVRLKRHFKPDVEAFRQHALDLPEVVRLYHVAGPIGTGPRTPAQPRDDGIHGARRGFAHRNRTDLRARFLP